ncbi:MAG TPA: FMN-binding protein [Xanthobacteraceae bacterium]|nr:FMN-binding protein [Xanthobacteraceae bacterium]
MTSWVRLTLPAAVIATIASPTLAVQYLTVDAAQRLAFPSANRFVENGGLTWKAQAGDKLLGLFVVDHVIGKHLYIDYAVALDPTGRVMRVDILQYRESYGGEVRERSWLAQFVGKTSGSALKVGSDIRNISGATLSSLHVTEGVKRILATYGSRTH